MKTYQRIWILTAATLLLTAAADILVSGHRPGAGWAVFCVVGWLALFFTRLERPEKTTRILLAIAMAASAAQTLWRPSMSNGICLVSLTLLLSATCTTKYLSLRERCFGTLVSLLSAPRRWSPVARQLAVGSNALSEHAPPTPTLLRGLKIIAPAAIIGLVFLTLLGLGNQVLGDLIAGFTRETLSAIGGIRLPGIARVGFWIASATLLLGLLWKPGRSAFADQISRVLPKHLNLPGDTSGAIWSTRLTLIAANLVYLAANSIDVVFLWASRSLPEELTYSEFVHQGTDKLIFSVILAGLTLTAIWHQKPEIKGAKGQTSLAIFWIFQNLLLVGSVLLRLSMYVEQYHLSAQRLHLIIFLTLVSLGFLFLAYRVVQDLSLSWLIRANLIAVAALFFGLQFWDTKATVANHNLNAALTEKTTPDLSYLNSLGPSGWRAMAVIAHGHQGTATGKNQATQLLQQAIAQEKKNASHWEDFQGLRYQLLNELDGQFGIGNSGVANR